MKKELPKEIDMNILPLLRMLRNESTRCGQDRFIDIHRSVSHLRVFIRDENVKLEVNHKERLEAEEIIEDIMSMVP